MFKKQLYFFIFFTFIIISGCSSGVTKPDELNYSIKDLYYNHYQRLGDPWIGYGYKSDIDNKEIAQQYLVNEDVGNDTALPLRTKEVIKRVLVNQNNISGMVIDDMHYQYIYLKASGWRE